MRRKAVAVDGDDGADADDDAPALLTKPAPARRAAGRPGAAAAAVGDAGVVFQRASPLDAYVDVTVAAPQADAKRKLGALAVAVISFAAVAGGPYGIEAAVGAAGALPVLLGSVVLAVTWSATQALVAAELSTMFASNGGYITWVVRGLGPVAGFVNACNTITSAVCNLPLYPVMFASYVASSMPGASPAALWGVKLVALALTLGLNVAGIEAVGLAALVFSVVVQVPFVLIPVVAAVLGQPFDWGAVAAVAPGWRDGVSVFVSTLCWNSQGWVNIGSVASEVRDPRRSYPLGSALAVVAVALNYMYPVALCVALAPDAGDWDTGYFTTLAGNVAPWLGVVTTVGAAFSAANNFVPQLGTTARALRFAALYGMLPVPALRRNWARTNTPVPALALQALAVGVLMSLSSFDVLVVVNVLFYNVGLALQFAAFLRLKYTAPDAPRPYAVPGGKAGAWAVVSVFACVLGVSLYAAAVNAGWVLAGVAGANVAFVAGGVAWARWGYVEGVIELVDAAEAAGLDAEAVAGGGAVPLPVPDAEGGGGAGGGPAKGGAGASVPGGGGHAGLPWRAAVVAAARRRPLPAATAPAVGSGGAASDDDDDGESGGGAGRGAGAAAPRPTSPLLPARRGGGSGGGGSGGGGARRASPAERPARGGSAGPPRAGSEATDSAASSLLAAAYTRGSGGPDGLTGRRASDVSEFEDARS